MEIPYEYGLLGHSDADVLLHAIIDALLGAAGLGDIGRHFPDSDERYRGVDSRVLLRCTGELLAQAGWRIVNVDSTINVQRPKMWPHLPQMVSNIASDLLLPEGRLTSRRRLPNAWGLSGAGKGFLQTQWS